MRAAIVKNGVIENIIIVSDLSFCVDSECEIVDVEGTRAGIGWVRVGGVFVDPEAEQE